MRKIEFVFLTTLMVIVCFGFSGVHAEEIVWVVKESKMPTGRANLTGVVVGTDIYTLGGHGGPNTYSRADGMRINEVYHTATDSWEIKALIPRYRGTYGFPAAVADNKIFMFGGGNPPGSGHYNYITMYDVIDNTWTKDVAYLPYHIAGGVAVEYNGYIYIFGGRSGRESGPGQPHRKLAIKFDPVTYSYTNLSEYPVYGSGRSAFVFNDLIYIFGGYTATQANSPYGTKDGTPPVMVYDPANDNWMFKGDVPIGGNPVLVNGTVYLIKQNLSIAYKYDIDDDSWTPVISTFPNDTTGGFRETSCFAGVNGKIYLIGGQSYTSGRLNTVIEGAIIPDNVPPAADAGPDIITTSEELSGTVITGSASDEDAGDNLEYQWKKGDTILVDWAPVGENGECPLFLSTVSLAIGSHTLTLLVSDGEEVVNDTMVLTIQNSSPHVAANGGGEYEINSPVTLGGIVSDFDGDLLSYQWLEGSTVLFTGTLQAISGGTPSPLPGHTLSNLPLGNHSLTLKVSDGINEPVYETINVTIVDTTPPVLAPVADKMVLWPPNHKIVDIVIHVNASDNSGLPLTLSAIISSNEPESGTGKGDKTPDWTEPQIDQENGIITFQLRAERSGRGNDRIYTITIIVSDSSGNSTTENMMITVPHDRGK
jgi:hypothetical protein